MGKIVVTEFISLDGVVEDPGGSEDFKYGGWSFEFSRGEEGDKFKLDEAFDAEALLLGRVTYEGLPTLGRLEAASLPTGSTACRNTSFLRPSETRPGTIPQSSRATSRKQWQIYVIDSMGTSSFTAAPSS